MVFSNSLAIKNSNPNIILNFNNSNENHSNLLLRIEKVSNLNETNTIRFLGIHIDNGLTYQHHISIIKSKLSKALYILRKSKNILSQKSLKAIYYSLFHSNLIFCLPIWSCTSQKNLKPLIVLQKSAIRIISKAAYNAHTEPLFKSNNILPLNDLIQFFNLQTMHRYIQGFLPTAFNQIWLTNQERRNETNTDQDIHRLLRNSANLNIPFVRLSFSQNQPLVKLPKTWSEFQVHEIKIIRNKNEFNLKLKKYFIDKLSFSTTCHRLLCPSCHLINNQNVVVP